MLRAATQSATATTTVAVTVAGSEVGAECEAAATEAAVGARGARTCCPELAAFPHAEAVGQRATATAAAARFAGGEVGTTAASVVVAATVRRA